MSVLIKGIEMPKEGRLTLQISADGAVYVVNRCNITAETYTTEATPVPPHGRLIDADEMKESVRKQTAFLRLIGGEFAEIAETIEKGFLQEIDNAPTIIEAEEGE